jgi:hypothetical protein
MATQRLVYICVSVGMFIIAGGALWLRFNTSGNPQGQIVMAVMFSMAGIFYAWRVYKTPRDMRIPSVQDLPIQDQTIFFKRAILVIALLFPVAAAVIAYGLHQLESGIIDVPLPGQIVVLYENFGYWPAVLALPLFGLFVCVASAAQLKKLKARGEERVNSTGEHSGDSSLGR